MMHGSTQKMGTTATEQRKITQAKSPQKNSKIKAGTGVVSGHTRIKNEAELVLINEFGHYRTPICRTGIILISEHSGKKISDRANRWLRKWTTPGLDSTFCKCRNCGGIRYVDEQMIARLKKRDFS